MFHPLRIAAVTHETDDAISLTLDVPATLKSRFAHRPGQYLTLQAIIDGISTRRAYSICSGLDDPALRIAIKRAEGGLFSSWAHGTLENGQTIDAMPPEGRFTVTPEPTQSRVYLGIAAGSGITPILSILKSVLTREPNSRFILLYGSRSTAKILFRTELEGLKDRFIGRLSIVHVLSREQQDIPILNGRLDAEKLATLLPGLMPGALPNLALICGPADMIETTSAALAAAGMPAGSILTERFSTDAPPRSRPPPSPPSTRVPLAHAMATVIADGISTAVPLQEGETILDAALRAGLDLPYSCHAGMCSTCRARVIEGGIVMDVNYGLEPWETEAGYVLTCQAHPTTAHVTVDYDHV